MTETGYLKEAEKFEIQAYEKPQDLKDLKDKIFQLKNYLVIRWVTSD